MPDELDQLAHELAYAAARGDIECCCVCVRARPYKLYDLAFILPDDPLIREAVDRSVRYLELRKLLVRGPQPTYVRVLAEACAP
jgi:hypothetical protein